LPPAIVFQIARRLALDHRALWPVVASPPGGPACPHKRGSSLPARLVTLGATIGTGGPWRATLGAQAGGKPLGPHSGRVLGLA